VAVIAYGETDVRAVELLFDVDPALQESFARLSGQYEVVACRSRSWS
jgi:hypothetical protein